MRTQRTTLPEQIRKSSTNKIIDPRFDADLLVPTGSTLLNCCCSDTAFGGWHLGKIVTLPGSSQSGKSFFALTAFAEANLYPRFDEFDFIYDDVEEACEFNIPYLFGESAATRIKAPAYDGKTPVYSNTIQDFQSFILKRCKATKKECKPFIWVEDSLDALTSDEELEKEYRKAIARAQSREALQEIKGSYKTEKAKIMGQVLRIIKSELKKTNSLLIIVQQIRDKIGASFGKKTTTSGGHAPFFYSAHQVWLSTRSAHKVNGTKIGTHINVELTKNKLTGKERSFETDIFYDYGIDDIGTNVDYLCKGRYFDNDRDTKGKIKPNTYVIPELNLIGQKNTLKAAFRKDPDLAFELQKLVGKYWTEFEDSIKLGWRAKYK